MNASPSLPSDANSSEPSEFPKPSLLSSIFASLSSARDQSDPQTPKKKPRARINGWALTLKKITFSVPMQRIHDRVLGPSKPVLSTHHDIWLLGLCYKLSQDEKDNASGLSSFMEDFTSRILITYRKGFDPIGDTKFSTDANWGCMLRSSQMLVAQALLVHKLGRSWRKKASELNPEYVEILRLFGDSEASTFSIHNLLEAGKANGLVAGMWIGPYAMCCSWKSLAASKTAAFQSFPLAIYVVSSDSNGERGGAPVVSVEDASKHCLDVSNGESDWTALLILIPLVLGLEKINQRYIPSLQATLSFPQSLGILGGRPGASTYIVGVQDSNALYLDPHCCQQVVSISEGDVGADTSSYHCDVVRQVQFESLDSSLAIGFYCRDKDDFGDFCDRASKLGEESNGAPLFTVVDGYSGPTSVHNGEGIEVQDEFLIDGRESDTCSNDDEWQLL